MTIPFWFVLIDALIPCPFISSTDLYCSLIILLILPLFSLQCELPSITFCLISFPKNTDQLLLNIHSVHLHFQHPKTHCFTDLARKQSFKSGMPRRRTLYFGWFFPLAGHISLLGKLEKIRLCLVVAAVVLPAFPFPHLKLAVARFPRFFSKVIKCWTAGPQLPRWKTKGGGKWKGDGVWGLLISNPSRSGFGEWVGVWVVEIMQIPSDGVNFL